MRRFCHPKREKSLVAVRSDFAGNSGDISKAEFRFDIWQFESCQGSQPVPSLWAVSDLRKTARTPAAQAADRGSLWPKRRADTVSTGRFAWSVSGRKFSISDFFVGDSVRKRRDWFDTLNSLALRAPSLSNVG